MTDLPGTEGATVAHGILGVGAYVPSGRLSLAEVGEVLVDGRARKGQRPVASYDEDTTTLAVEACRDVLRTVRLPDIDALLFSTPVPAYLEKSNASAVHAGLNLPDAVAAYDFLGSGRSSAGALAVALRSGMTTLAVASDIRTGLPGSNDEIEGADAAVAILVGEGRPVAVLQASASITREYLDRWRLPEEAVCRSWEERFGEQASMALGQEAAQRALKTAELQPTDVDWVVVSGVRARSTSRLRAVAPEAKAHSTMVDVAGNAGCAQLGLDLLRVLERAAPGDVILCLSISDGADALLLRATEAVTQFASREPLDGRLRRDGRQVPYATYLSWRGLLQRDPPRRPDPPRPSAPAAQRSERWKYGLVGSQCTGCGEKFLPPQRVCLGCGVVDDMVPISFAELKGRVATFTVDRLAYSPSPPVVAAVIDFEGGGRFPCELTDADPETLHLGQPVTMTFRRLYTAGGIHNYFWKAKPDDGDH